jgi:hypothetical protein
VQVLEEPCAEKQLGIWGEYTGVRWRSEPAQSAKLAGKWHRHLSLCKIVDEEDFFAGEEFQLSEKISEHLKLIDYE